MENRKGLLAIISCVTFHVLRCIDKMQPRLFFFSFVLVSVSPVSAIHFVAFFFFFLCFFFFSFFSFLSHFYLWPAGLGKVAVLPIEFHTTALLTSDLSEASFSICGPHSM